MTKTLVVSDLHIPFHDDSALEVMNDIKFDNFIINGDLIDGWDLSKFSKDPKKKIDFSEEIDSALDILYEFSKRVKGNKYFVVGNHDFRLEKYLIDQASGLISLNKLTIESLLELDKFGFESINMGREGYININNVLVGHFNRVSKHSAYTAKALVEQ